jgi:fermentation-respiration switch protein FrsA (DUF1100 family)
MKFIISIIVIPLFLFFFIRFIEKKSLYFPFKAIEATPKAIGLDYEDITVTTEDGVQLTGWLIPAERSRATLLLSHGNAGNISHRLDKIKILNDLNLDILIYDYRGYGMSTGEPSEDGLYMDVQAMYDYLVDDRKISPDKIIAYGESLGGAVAVNLAVKNEVGGLIIESSFTSIHDMAQKLLLYVPRFALKTAFDSLNKIKNIRVPTLIMHSPADEVIPFSHGRKLFDNAADPKVFVELQGGHNDGFLVSGEVYSKGIDEFVDIEVQPRY